MSPYRHDRPQTATELGHQVFHLMAELSQMQNEPHAVPEHIEDARRRLVRMHDKIADALRHNGDIASYDAGLRSAVMTHLNACSSARADISVFEPLPPSEVHALRREAQDARQASGNLAHLGQNVRHAIADLLEAQARVGEALRTSAEPCILVM